MGGVGGERGENLRELDGRNGTGAGEEEVGFGVVGVVGGTEEVGG